MFYIYISIVFILSVAGGALPLARKWSDHSLTLSLSFSAGILLSAAFLHMVPESFEHFGTEYAGAAILGGFLLIVVVEKFILKHSCHDPISGVSEEVGMVAYIGILFHSLLDGIALGAGSADPEIGWVVFLSILMHKFPSAFALSSILIASKMPRKKIIALIAIFAAAVPLGAFTTYFLIKEMSMSVIGAAIGLSAGTFLAIATSDLLPRVEEDYEHRTSVVMFFFLGLLAMSISLFFELDAH